MSGKRQHLGAVLLGILRDLENGWRNYPAHYETALILVDMGLAEFVEPRERGRSYWLAITPAGRLALSSNPQEASDG